MNSIDDSTLRLLAGKPIIFKDICLIYSPTLDEIASIGLSKFYAYLSVMLIEKPKVEEEALQKIVDSMSDFDFLIFLSQTDANQYNLIKQAFQFFTHDTNITFTLEPPSVLFGEFAEKRSLAADQFDEFRYFIKMACAMLSSDEDDIVILESDSEKVKEIKRKLLLGRKRRAQAKKSENKDVDALRLSDLIGSLSMGCSGLNVIDVWKLNYYAFQDQLKRMGWHEEFDINIRAAMAGAKIDQEKLSHWMKPMTFK